MKSRTGSNLIMLAMIALCVSAVAAPSPKRAPDQPKVTNAQADLSAAANALALAVLWSDDNLAPNTAAETGRASRADRAIKDAAQVAGEVVSEIEMPFFSFGGNAAAE